MKFIPGNLFCNKTSKHTRLFKPGLVYKLNNIQHKDGKVHYTFRVNGELKHIPFDSVKQADEWLEIISYN
jgi:hypothetical protein